MWCWGRHKMSYLYCLFDRCRIQLVGPWQHSYSKRKHSDKNLITIIYKHLSEKQTIIIYVFFLPHKFRRKEKEDSARFMRFATKPFTGYYVLPPWTETSRKFLGTDKCIFRWVVQDSIYDVTAPLLARRCHRRRRHDVDVKQLKRRKIGLFIEI